MTMNGKRISAALVITVLVAALLGVVGTQNDVRGSGQSAPQLEGSWEVTVMPNGGAPIVDLATFSQGGGLLNSDPDPALSTGHGTWVRTGGHSFATTFVHFLSDPQGNPLGTLKVRAELSVDPQTDTFSGPFRTDVFIGGDLVQSFCGVVQAKRIGVEPLEACP
jgi:hypothetical protein